MLVSCLAALCSLGLVLVLQAVLAGRERRRFPDRVKQNLFGGN